MGVRRRLWNEWIFVFLRFPYSDTLYRVFIKNGVVSNVYYKSVIQMKIAIKVLSLHALAETVMFKMI